MWQTELSDDKGRQETWPDAMKWAKTFHAYMANANMSAFVWWSGARPCSTTGENLIQLEEALPSYILLQSSTLLYFWTVQQIY